MKRNYMAGIWWGRSDSTDLHNGYNAATDEDDAVFRIGKLHFWWGGDDE